jgi:hypothetical protein
MAQITMYPAKVNSIATTLSQAYTIGDNHIHVTDETVFPTAPNLATIGTGEDAVTYNYTSTAAGLLNGVTVREGTDKNWSIGDKIARRFTAFDLDTVKANIEDHETRFPQRAFSFFMS